MKNNYTSLKSPIDEEDELKTGHEIDLEKGLLPEYDSEEEGALPPYSDHARVSNPPNTHRENHSSGTTDDSSPFLIKLLISFTPIVLLNALAVWYLKYKDAFFKNYGAAEWTLFGFWCLVCTLVLIILTYFYETWTKAVKVTVIFLAQCIKVTAVFLAQCVKGLFNIRREMMIIIWILWLIICCILFGCVKDGRLNFNKALICSTCTISAVLFLIVSSVCIPIWTLWRALSGMLQVLGIHGIIAVLVNGSMSLFGKHFGWRGYEIEGFVLFFTSNALFLYEMERPGVLKRMRNTTGNVIGYICGGIEDAFRRIKNAFRGANDNNNIPLGEMDVEGEV
uniref:Meiotic drive suppressor wtf23 n=1 Tax=Schizosaccharomyces kambucha TaxID=204045 RepID=WTF23_SCHKA|nr:RecName: Full=Meiotic drive suppressor wtf23 [Schizosaccharomyces kambucha]QBL54511.1 Wtf23 [Schizosaccharomyces kambucha]